MSTLCFTLIGVSLIIMSNILSNLQKKEQDATLRHDLVNVEKYGKLVKDVVVIITILFVVAIALMIGYSVGIYK